MKFEKEFSSFLRDEVNINRTRLDDLETHVKSIEEYLRGHEIFGSLVKDVIPQGSWAHLTIIKPLPDKEYDADFLLELQTKPSWSPKDYILELRSAFLASDRYKEKVSKRARCVRIQYAGDCHVDVVPFVRLSAGGQIMNSNEDSYEPTNPEEFTGWFDDQTEATNGHLRKVVRLVKYLRDIKQTFTVKSVILSTLLCNQVGRLKTAGISKFPDVPTTLQLIMASLAEYLALYPYSPPSVPDPSSPGATFDHRWPSDVNVYQNFRKQIRYYADKISAAYNTPLRDDSLKIWREVFGDSFASGSVREASLQLTPTRAPSEKFITDPDFGNISDPGVYPHSVSVHCEVAKKPGFRHGDLRRLSSVEPNRSLTFSVASCSAPWPYEIFWKVKNTGSAAAAERCFRGEIYPGQTRSEPTKYRGQHWVECYIVKDSVCVAKQKYTVRIR